MKTRCSTSIIFITHSMSLAFVHFCTDVCSLFCVPAPACGLTVTCESNSILSHRPKMRFTSWSRLRMSLCVESRSSYPFCFSENSTSWSIFIWPTSSQNAPSGNIFFLIARNNAQKVTFFQGSLWVNNFWDSNVNLWFTQNICFHLKI